jgi:hypothetical protein
MYDTIREKNKALMKTKKNTMGQHQAAAKRNK